MSTDPNNPTHKFLAIIGAGISGIVAGAEVHRKNVLRNPTEEMVMFDTNGGFGGVWYANTYPGAACDIVSHIYSISWFPKPDWSRRYSHQDEIRGYYEGIAHHYNLNKSCKFRHSVLAAHWSDDDCLWHLTVQNNTTNTLHYYICNSLLSAIGQLNRAKRANFPGVERFQGHQFHTAEWDHSVDLKGKRVAIIGTGPSAGQIIPSIAKDVKELHVFQRSPPHVLPRHDYIFSGVVKFLFTWIPLIQWFHHLYLYIDQELGPYLSVHLGTEAHINTTIAAQKHMESQIPSSRPDLRQKFTPIYEFGCKRPMFLDTYYPTFLLSHVHLDTSPIQEINSSSITTLSGTKDIDVIIWATGFQTQDYLGHVDVRGTGGVRLKSQWGDTAQAYLGTSVHNFPNLFFIYGPGAGLLWGSLTFMFETQALWVAKVLKTVYANLGRGKRTAFAVKQDVEREYNVAVQEKMKQLAFTDPKCTSFYKNDRGVVTTNWPWRLAEYWRRLSSIEWENYDMWETRA